MKKPSRVLLSLVVAAALIVALARWGGVSTKDLGDAWERLSWRALAAAFAIYAAQYGLRALRFWLLIPPLVRPPYTSMLSVTSAYGLAALTLPARIGEATYVVYSSKAGGLGTAEAVASLVVARLLDFATLFLGFGVSCIALDLAGLYPRFGWFGSLGGALLALSIAVFALSARGDLLVRWVAGCTRALGFGRSPRAAWVFDKVDGLGLALRAAAQDGRLWKAATVSLPMWACVFLFCAVLGKGFGLPDTISIADASFGASLAILTSLVPVSAFANFGTLETGWVLGFGVLGVPRDLAFATGTGLHVVQVVFAVALGLVGHLGMAMGSRRVLRV